MSSTTDTREKGIETLIAKSLIHEAGCLCGNPAKYNHEYCVDLAQLSAFLRETQLEVAETLALGEDGPTRCRFLARLQGEIAKRGIIDVLRHSLKHVAHDLDLFYGTPSAGNVKAKTLYEANCFSATRQLRYSRDSSGTMPKICQGHIKSWRILYPSLEEQRVVVEKLDADTVQINETITIAQHQIDLIREYRTRLIADVVTGKVDVRDIPVEDVPEDEALEEFVESREIEEALDIGEIQDAKQ